MNMHHEKQISSIAEKVYDGVMNGKIKYIGIAGPSASGKTTFTKKLGISLKSRGLNLLF